MNVRGTVRPGLTTRLVEDESHADYDPHTPLRSSARVVGPYQIAQLDRENGRLLVRTHEHEGAFRPVPSPDGKWLVYSTRYDARQALKLIDLSTGEDRWLTMDVQRDDSQGGGARDRDVYPKSAFTPDSKSLITSYDGKIWRVCGADGRGGRDSLHREGRPAARAAREVRLSDRRREADGVADSRRASVTRRQAHRLHGARPFVDRRSAAGPRHEEGKAGCDEPATSRASGSRAAEASRRTAREAGARARRRRSPTIRNARRLTTGTDVEHGPVWSPDGQFIAYVTWNDDDGGRIYRVRADGSGQPERLTPVAAFYDKLTYSRDGSRLIGVRGSKMHRLRTLEDFGSHSGSAELEYVWLPATRRHGHAHRLGRPAGRRSRGARRRTSGPMPNRVYVWAGSEGLLSMRYDGTDIKTDREGHGARSAAAPGAPGPPPTPDEVVLSPDGKRALVRANRNVYMITVPPVAGAAPTVSAAASSSVPTWRLTKVGGDFIGWTADSQAALLLDRPQLLPARHLHAGGGGRWRTARRPRPRPSAPLPRRRPTSRPRARRRRRPRRRPRRRSRRRRRRSRRSSTSRTASTSRSSSTRTSRAAPSRCATRG